MVQFISNPELLIAFSVVEYSIIYHILPKSIYNFHFVEVDHSSIRCAARNVCNDICLDKDTHFNELLVERDTEMNAWFSH